MTQERINGTDAAAIHNTTIINVVISSFVEPKLNQRKQYMLYITQTT